MELKDRVKEIVKYSKKSIPQFATFIGVKTPQAIRELMSGRTKTLSESMQDKILQSFPEINKTWLLAGEGKMINEATERVEYTDALDKVPLIPIEAMAGPLTGFSEGVDPRFCRRVNSPVSGADFAIQISGDSMEPDYPNGSLLYIKKINTDIFIPWGHPVILDTENGPVFKKIFKNPDNPDYIIARSINPDYPDLDIYAPGIYGLYKVVGMSRITSTL